MILRSYSHGLRCRQNGSPHAVETLYIRLKLGTVGLLVPGTVAVTRELLGVEGDVVGEGGELAGAGLALAVVEEVNKLMLGDGTGPGGGGGGGRAAGGRPGEAVRRLLLQIEYIAGVTLAVAGGVAGSLVGVIALRRRGHIHAGEHGRGWGRGVGVVTSVVTST